MTCVQRLKWSEGGPHKYLQGKCGRKREGASHTGWHVGGRLGKSGAQREQGEKWLVEARSCRPRGAFTCFQFYPERTVEPTRKCEEASDVF